MDPILAIAGFLIGALVGIMTRRIVGTLIAV